MDFKLFNSKTWDKYKTQIALLSIAFLVLILFIITSPRVFLSPQIYRSFLSTVPFVGVMALGLTLILAMGKLIFPFRL